MTAWPEESERTVNAIHLVPVVDRTVWWLSHEPATRALDPRALIKRAVAIASEARRSVVNMWWGINVCGPPEGLRTHHKSVAGPPSGVMALGGNHGAAAVVQHQELAGVEPTVGHLRV